MSLCADCFQAGDHTGHDFNMFRSQAGGACDCGDITVMRECGYGNPLPAEQDYCRFYPALLVNQITNIGKEMCL